MKISYVILYNQNDYKELTGLLRQLKDYKDINDEIIILYDGLEFDSAYYDLKKLVDGFENIIIDCNPLNKDFANQRNYASKLCSGDYIFHIDADELIDDVNLFANIKQILEANNNIEVFGIPRINIVNGITPADIKKWNWIVDVNGYVNFPDYQYRLYKNKKEIKWEGVIHEHVAGFNSITRFDQNNPLFYLNHTKDIIRQRKQNSFYETI